MNNDHQLALYDCLCASLTKHRFDLNDPKYSAELLDITPSSITIKYTYSGSPNVQYAELPINPPMSDNTLRESRSALVQMAKNAAASRGYSTTRITKFVPLGSGPSALSDLALFSILYTLTVPPIRSAALRLLGISFGTQFDGSRLLDWIPFAIMISIHAVEAYLVMGKKTHKYRVPAPQKFWWIITNTLEGFPAISRFNALVRDVEGRH